MKGLKICFYGEMGLIVPELSLLPLLIWSTVIGEVPIWDRISPQYRLEPTDLTFKRMDG